MFLWKEWNKQLNYLWAVYMYEISGPEAKKEDKNWLSLYVRFHSTFQFHHLKFGMLFSSFIVLLPILSHLPAFI